MRTLSLFAAAFVLHALTPISISQEAAPPPLSPEEQLQRFKVPPGFEVQLVASEPQIQKPVNITFDTAGRIWTTGSELYPWPAATDALGQPIPGFQKVYQEAANAFARGKGPEPQQAGRDTVRVLSDFAADGRAQKIAIFADALNIPTGIQPLPRKPGAKGDTVLVYSIPNIWRFEDTNGDGKADKREPLYEGFGFIDTHGMSSNYIHWLDGWIYGCHGFRNRSEVKDRQGNVTVFESGNTYRFKPDGSKIEYWSHGQTNPFGLAFDPLGNLYSADSHSKPVYLLLRGAHYEGIGKQHDGLGFAPRITDDDHGSSAIAGIMHYADNQWPQEFHGNLFNGNPVTQRVNRAKLDWNGSTPRSTRLADFVSCDDPWFRPVQVKLGPDGAMYIADFYNPIIGHYEVPLTDPRRDNKHGRIWRVVYRGEKDAAAAFHPLPDLTQLSPEGLVKRLGNSNLVLRQLVHHELVERIGKEAAPLLQRLSSAEDSSAAARISAIYALRAISALDDKTLKRSLSGEPLERVHAMKLLSQRTADGETMEQFSAGLKGDPHVRRAVAEALRISLAAGNPALHEFATFQRIVTAWLDQTPPEDSELVHTYRMLLRDLLRKPGGYDNAEKLIAKSDKALIPLMDISFAVQTAEASQFMLRQLKATNLALPRTGDYLRHAVLFLPKEQFSAVIELLQNFDAVPLSQKLAVADGLEKASRERGEPLPQELAGWVERVVVQTLASDDPAIVDRAIAAVRQSTIAAKFEPLQRIVTRAGEHGPRRAAALEAVMNLDRGPALAAAALADPSSMTLRKKAAELLGQVNSKEAQEALLAALPTAPFELATSIATALAKNDRSTEQLLAVIESGKASPALLRNKAVAGPLGGRAQPLRDRAAKLTADLPPEDARLDQLIAQRTADFRAAQPEIGRGNQLFQQHCAVCHKVKNVGGNIGPNLDGVGARGVHRLIEDILDPNRNVDPAFRQTIIETADGSTLAGVNVREQGELLVLNDVAGKEQSVPKEKVKSQTQSRMSLMPAIYEQTLSPAELNDLLAFLIEQSGDPAK